MNSMLLGVSTAAVLLGGHSDLDLGNLGMHRHSWHGRSWTRITEPVNKQKNNMVPCYIKTLKPFQALMETRVNTYFAPHNECDRDFIRTSGTPGGGKSGWTLSHMVTWLAVAHNKNSIQSWPWHTPQFEDKKRTRTPAQVPCVMKYLLSTVYRMLEYTYCIFDKRKILGFSNCGV